MSPTESCLCDVMCTASPKQLQQLDGELAFQSHRILFSLLFKRKLCCFHLHTHRGCGEVENWRRGHSWAQVRQSRKHVNECCMSASLSRLTPSRQAQLGCSAERVSPARKQAHQPRASHAGRRPCGMRRSGRMAQLSGTQTAAPNCIAREASPAARAEPAQASVPSRALEAALWARGFNVVVGAARTAVLR
jgi:hypothetical protein